MGLRGIERVTNIHHTTVMHWIREAGQGIADAPQSDEIPEITDLDELQTFVGNKRQKIWKWSCCQSLGLRYLGLGSGRPECGNVQTPVVDSQMLA